MHKNPLNCLKNIFYRNRLDESPSIMSVILRSLSVNNGCAVNASVGEVKRFEPVKISTQSYREKVHYSKLFKTVHDHLVVIKINNTFQSAVIHYSCWFHIWFY